MSKKFYISGDHEGGGATLWRTVNIGGGKFYFTDEEVSEEIFSREVLEGEMKFTRSDAKFILDAPFDTTFTIVYGEFASVSNARWVGQFHITDCKIDEARTFVRVTPETVDNKKSIMEGKGKEFDLIQAEPPFVQLDLVRRSILQVYVRGAEKLTNYVGSSFWEVQVDNPSEVPSRLQGDFRFGFSGRKYFVTGSGLNLSPDVSGVYIFNTVTQISTSENGLFRLFFNNIPDNRAVIERISDGQRMYEGALDDPIPNLPVEASQGVLMTSTSTNDKVRAFYVDFYTRILTNQTEVNGDATFEIDEDDDILNDTGVFKRVLQREFTNFVISERNTSEGSRWGRFPEGSQHFEGNHYLKPENGVFYPVLQSNWIDASFWLEYESDLLSDLDKANQDYTVRHCYKISDSIKVLLREMGSDITHEESSEYSQFLYGQSNSIRGVKKVPLIIPITNILVGDYDEPDPSAKIKLDEIFDLMKKGPRVFWDVDSEGRLRMEHISFYDNGGSYSGQVVGQDLTELIDGMTSKKWSFLQEEYEFEKSEMQERFEYGWQGKSSKAFDGYPTEVLSKFVQKGNVGNFRIGRFYADIDLINVGGAEISKDSFLYCEAIEENGRLKLPFVEVEIDEEETYNLQNGYAAFVWMVPNYHLYSMPGSSLLVNKYPASAVTLARRRLQPLKLATSEEVSSLELIKTNLGTGKPFRVKAEVFGNEVEINARHDNE